ncbi:MAG: preprotein translocase subunit SecE [Moraxellaceae bacterium]|nr:preprotein translocase subunit SecE [Moraxellaceae bacterium]
MSTQFESSARKLDWVKWLVVVVLLVAATLGNQYAADISVWIRMGAVVVVSLVALGLALTTAKGRDLIEMSKKSWIEAQKIVWPTKDETWQTTLIVLAVVVVASLLLWFVDFIFGRGISAIIG